ncbi:MAG: DNA gyrase subunit A [Gemmatimonadota bacterium]
MPSVQSVQKERIQLRGIEQEMRDSFIDYSMSVIVQRALPDARDGLKPVHRRILYAMRELGLTPDRPHKKSATVVGDVLGKYHPHGDSAVYDAIVRMVQEFSLRYPLVDGQGNFGSIDGDSAAAYRYTEVRLTPLALETLAAIDRDTVEFVPNFDGRLSEPTVLPSRLPHLLLNGADGIAVGMATKIPPQNIGELLRAADHLAAHPECEIQELMKLVHGPDFPTGGYIWGHQGLREAYLTGRGLIDMRARIHREEGSYGKSSLVVTELPYQVNKTRVIEQITKLVRGGRTDAITELRDESDRDGIRLVIELKRDADPRKVVDTLFKKTQLRYTFGVIMLALVDGRPRELNLKQALECWVDHRLEVIRRKAAFELERSEERAHVIEGLLLALDSIDRVVALIRGSRTPASARTKLVKELTLTERQAEAILAMRLSRLTGLERRKLREELEGLQRFIRELRHLLEEEAARRAYLRRELRDLLATYGDDRRTEILESDRPFPIPAGIGGEATLLLLSRRGYVKAQPVRNGGGMAGAEALAGREGDFVRQAFLCRGSDRLLALTARGHAHLLRIADLPRGTRSSRGKPLAELLGVEPGDSVVSVLPVDEFDGDRYVVVATRRGRVKRSPLAEYANIRGGGIIGAGLAKGDEVLAAFLTDGTAELLLASRRGQAIRFREEEIRPMGRGARGVRGMEIGGDDELVAALVPRRDSDLAAATELGFGKRIPFTEFRLQGRAGKGTNLLPERKQAGGLVGLLEVQPGDRVMWELSDGELVATKAEAILGRARREASRRVVPLAGGDARVTAVHPLRATPDRLRTDPDAPASQPSRTPASNGASRPEPTAAEGADADGQLDLMQE